MTAEPDFVLHGRLNDALDAARGPARVPEGKGGHVFVDGTLYRILDIKTPLKGAAAFGYSVNEKELIHLCAHIDVAALGFKGLRTTTIEPLQQLGRLESLSLWWVQKLADLSPLRDVPLEVLVLDDIRYAQDISAVGAIPTLRALTIAGGMSTTQMVETLEPLTNLPQLSELRLLSVKLGNDSLRPLARCKALRHLNLPNTFPTEDYAYLRAKCPDLRCASLAAYQSTGSILRIHEVMVTGRRKPFLNSIKDAARLAKYQNQFDALVAKYQATGSCD